MRASLGAGRRDSSASSSPRALLLALLGWRRWACCWRRWGVDLLLALKPADLPRLDDVRVDGTVLGFALALAVGTGLAVRTDPRAARLARRA